MPEDIFLWHAQSSKETGILLAQNLGVKHGNIPPESFKGVLICWGASPSEKFKWENRTIKSLLNDPRKIQKYKDRKVLFDLLTSAGYETPSCIALASDINYDEICELISSPIKEGFFIGKKTGTALRKITNQEQMPSEDKKNLRIFSPDFCSDARIRVFVYKDRLLGALQRGETTSNEVFVHCATNSVSGDESFRILLEKLIEQEVIKPNKTYWAPYIIIPWEEQLRVLNISKTLGFDFCAIDFSPDLGTVLNVLTTPSLTMTPTILAPIVNEISAWVAEKTRTTKETLLAMINEATDREVDSLFERLCGPNPKLSNEKGETNTITSRTDSSSTE